MITPKEIETKDFSKTKGGGYRAEEVDQFLDEILVDYSHLLEERNALKNKVNLLSEKLTAASERPAPIAPAPVAPATVAPAAPAPAAPVVDEDSAARRKAQQLVADAEDYARKLIETAQSEAARQNSVAKKLADEIERFRASLLETYSAHVEQVKKIPDLKYEDVKIGSETLDILKESFDESATETPAASFIPEAPVASLVPETPAAPEAPTAHSFVVEPESSDDKEETVPFEFVSSEPATRKHSHSHSHSSSSASRGLADLFDDDADKKKKKEKKTKRKLFFRDDDEDDDLFDDDDE